MFDRQGNHFPNIRAVDLFCGAGGMTHGLMRSGIDVVAGYDLDPNCRYPFEANNRAKFFEQDIRKLNVEDVAKRLSGADFSLVAGCPPCQPFSTYSRSQQRRETGDDWKLVEVFGQVIQQIQPDLIVMENVPQLAKHHVFADFLEYLKGYRTEWNVVEAERWGVPQKRRRLVLMASKQHKNPLELSGEVSRPVTVREAIGGLKPIRAGEVDSKDSLHRAPKLSDRNLQRIKHSKPGGTWRDWPVELQSPCHRKATGATYLSVYGRMLWDRPSPTITTQSFGYGSGRFGHPAQDRAISLREAAILQSFPQDYEFVRPGERVRYNVLGRMIGNAVPVRLAESIGEALLRHVAS